MFGLAWFVKPLPHQRCEAGFTNEVDSSKLLGAELRWSSCGFQSPDRRCNTVRNIQEAKKVIEEAGMELTDEEMEQVAGGGADFYYIGGTKPFR